MQVYNTLTGKKEPFHPLNPGKVGMYVCGVTVYDRCHIGHARSAILFDVMRRYLVSRGYAVTYVRNFTDVDDKIITRARQEGMDWRALAEKYVAAYHDDMDRLDVHPADLEPKATDFIEEMQTIIGRLLDEGIAYAIPSGIYYRVNRFKEYGKLSKRELSDLMAGARVEVDAAKENPLDFALWKASAPDEPAWESPWGPGRPGWHIECSAMSLKHLGHTLDIHGGGMDLIFPHHENEIAQSEAYTGHPFVRYWLHNGFVNVNQEKMSKSLGNFFTIEEIFEAWTRQFPSPQGLVDADSVKITAEVIRYFLLSTHYRSPLDFSDGALREAKAALDNFYTLFQKLEESQGRRGGEENERIESMLSRCSERFQEAMEDDFNTAEALAAFQKLRGEVNTLQTETLTESQAGRIQDIYSSHGKILGLFGLPAKTWRFKTTPPLSSPALDNEAVEGLVAEREQARQAGNWKRSDEIRWELNRMGVILEDRPDGTTRIKR